MSRIKRTNRFVAAALVLSMLSLSGCGNTGAVETRAELLAGKNTAGEQTDSGTVYETATARIGDYVKTSNADGMIVYPVTESVTYTGEAALLVEWLVESGDTVKKGDPVATIQVEYDTVELKEMKLSLERLESDYEWQLLNRKEQLESLRTAWQQAEGTAKKRAELEYQKAEKNLELYRMTAESGIENQSERIREFEERISVDTITASADGVVTERSYLKSGESIPQGQSLMTIYDPEVVWLRVTDSTGNLRYNMDVTIETGQAKKRVTMQGKVVSADNILSDPLRRGVAYVEVLDMPENVNWSNTSVKVKTIEIGQVVLVKRQAVQSDDGGNFIYLLEDGQLHKRQVIRAGQGAEDSWILMGLEEGQEVVIGQ